MDPFPDSRLCCSALIQREVLSITLTCFVDTLGAYSFLKTNQGEIDRDVDRNYGVLEDRRAVKVQMGCKIIIITIINIFLNKERKESLASYFLNLAMAEF